MKQHTSKKIVFLVSADHASIHTNCHHQVVHSSFNLSIYYPPPYQRLTWDYKKADSKNIRKAFNLVNWDRLFNINLQVTALNKTTSNVFRNYVFNEYITVDDKDPLWMNEIIKSKIKTRNYSSNDIFRMRDYKVTLCF